MSITCWNTQYSPRERRYSNVGSPIVQLFKPVFDKNGHMELEPNGTENLYERIQTWADSVDIHVLMKQFENGDISALNQRQGSFLDITEFPSSYAEMFNIMTDAENEFSTLPTDVKQKFNNSFREYLAMSQENPLQFAEFCGIISKEIVEKPTVSDNSQELENQ